MVSADLNGNFALCSIGHSIVEVDDADSAAVDEVDILLIGNQPWGRDTA